MSKKFTGFGLLTNDVKRLRLFYKDILEAEVEDNDVHCVVKVGEFSFAIYNPNLHENAEELFKTFRNSSVWLEFQVDDVDEEIPPTPILLLVLFPANTMAPPPSSLVLEVETLPSRCNTNRPSSPILFLL